MSLAISGGKQVLKFANTSNRGRLKQFDNFRHAKCTVRVSTGLTLLLFAVRTPDLRSYCIKKNNEHFHPSFPHDRDFLYWQILSLVCPLRNHVPCIAFKRLPRWWLSLIRSNQLFAPPPPLLLKCN